jgi:hypothetical protein
VGDFAAWVQIIDASAGNEPSWGYKTKHPSYALATWNQTTNYKREKREKYIHIKSKVQPPEPFPFCHGEWVGWVGAYPVSAALYRFMDGDNFIAESLMRWN